MADKKVNSALKNWESNKNQENYLQFNIAVAEDFIKELTKIMSSGLKQEEVKSLWRSYFDFERVSEDKTITENLLDVPVMDLFLMVHTKKTKKEALELIKKAKKIIFDYRERLKKKWKVEWVHCVNCGAKVGKEGFGHENPVDDEKCELKTRAGLQHKIKEF